MPVVACCNCPGDFNLSSKLKSTSNRCVIRQIFYDVSTASIVEMFVDCRGIVQYWQNLETAMGYFTVVGLNVHPFGHVMICFVLCTKKTKAGKRTMSQLTFTRNCKNWRLNTTINKPFFDSTKKSFTLNCNGYKRMIGKRTDTFVYR